MGFVKCVYCVISYSLRDSSTELVVKELNKIVSWLRGRREGSCESF